MIRVSCGCAVETATQDLVSKLTELGVPPFVSSTTIRTVYEGENHRLGEAIVNLYSYEVDHEITVCYDKEEERKSARRAQRKALAAAKNAKLHGH